MLKGVRLQASSQLHAYAPKDPFNPILATAFAWSVRDQGVRWGLVAALPSYKPG